MFWVGWVLGLNSLLYMSRLTFQPLVQQPMHTHTHILKYLCFIIKNRKENGDESLDCPGDTQPVVDKHPQERYTALLVCKYPHPT